MTLTATKLDFRDPDALNELFKDVFKRDRERHDVPEFLGRWLFAERLAARGVRREMGFDSFEGPIHLRKFFSWLQGADMSDFWEGERASALIEASAQADTQVMADLKLSLRPDAIEKVARYNMQDYFLQRCYPVPERQRIRTLLDFGAGHGRMANLAFNTPFAEERVHTYVAVDGIAASYFTQSMYYDALGLKVWDYFDHHDKDLSPRTIEKAMRTHDVVHLPTWRLDLMPAGSVDMVCCVQVLKELPGELVVHILPHFARVLKDAGAIYIRDHLQFHNPNHMPVDTLLQANGFSLEFAPQVKDRTDIHGLPRIHRKVDPSLYL